MDVSLGELRELVMDRKAWHAAIHGVTKVGHDWATELNWILVWTCTLAVTSSALFRGKGIVQADSISSECEHTHWQKQPLPLWAAALEKEDLEQDPGIGWVCIVEQSYQAG